MEKIQNQLMINLTERERIACAAMMAVIMSPRLGIERPNPEVTAKMAIYAADSIIKLGISNKMTERECTALAAMLALIMLPGKNKHFEIKEAATIASFVADSMAGLSWKYNELFRKYYQLTKSEK